MTTDTDDLRAFIYEVAEALAPTWERRRAEIEEFCAPVREWMLRELRPQAGDTVLELAAGAGDTGFEAATILGERGRLISTDFSPSMLEAARRRGAELGVENVEYRVMDAERIELDDESIDGVLCRFGYMLMPEPAAALSETRRVLRRGGRLALAVWGARERNPCFEIIGRILVERGHAPPPEPSPAPGPFSMASAERTTALLEAAGFGDVRREEVPVLLLVPDAREYLIFTADTGGPVASVLRGLPDAERDTIERQLELALAPYRTDRAYELPGVALCAVAS